MRKAKSYTKKEKTCVTQVQKGFWRASRPKCKPNRFDLVIAKPQLKLVIACIFYSKQNAQINSPEGRYQTKLSSNTGNLVLTTELKT